MNYQEQKLKAEKLFKSDDYPKAIVAYSKLYLERPNDQDNLDKIAFMFERIQDGNYELDPDSSEHYVMRGIAKFWRQEFNGAVEDLTEAIRLDNKNHYALKSRGFGLFMMGKVHQGIEDLQRAISISPEGEYFDDLANFHEQIDLKKAIEYHGKAIKASPDSARLWYNYGVILGESGNLQGALEKFNKALDIWPKYEDAQVNRDFVLQRLKK